MAEYTLPPLPYDYGALEPHIDAKTMEIHHDKHHQAYVTNLNNALKDHPDHQGKTIEDLIADLERRCPKAIRTAVRNNGGGHANHSLFWQIMKPGGGGEPTGALGPGDHERAGRLRRVQGGLRPRPAPTRFGSGWAWLVVGKDGKLAVTSTPNQDSPLMDGQTPRSSASTSGSTPTTSSTRTAGPTTSPPGGTRSTGTRSAAATRPPRSDRSRSTVVNRPVSPADPVVATLTRAAGPITSDHDQDRLDPLAIRYDPAASGGPGVLPRPVPLSSIAASITSSWIGMRSPSMSLTGMALVAAADGRSQDPYSAESGSICRDAEWRRAQERGGHVDGSTQACPGRRDAGDDVGDGRGGSGCRSTRNEVPPGAEVLDDGRAVRPSAASIPHPTQYNGDRRRLYGNIGRDRRPDVGLGVGGRAGSGDGCDAPGRDGRAHIGIGRPPGTPGTADAHGLTANRRPAPPHGRCPVRRRRPVHGTRPARIGPRVRIGVSGLGTRKPAPAQWRRRS